MTHDPICEWRPCTCPLDYDAPERGHMIGCPEDDCECDLIARVREDEATRAHRMSEAYRSALRDAVEAVKALPAKDQHDEDGLISLCFDKGEAVAAIESLGGER